jgi:hypothetical protein
MSNPDSRWIPAQDAVIAMAHSYAKGMQVDWAEALKRSQLTILRYYLSAGHWPARAGAYHCQKTFINTEGKREGVKLEKIWCPENQAWVIPRDYWQVLHRSGADENANWHLGEFDIPLHSEKGFSYSGFAKRVEIDRECLAQISDIPPASVDRLTKKPGRRPIGSDKYLHEFERRIQGGELAASVAEQSRELHQWYRAMYPDHKKAPAAGTIENTIRERYREAKAAKK